MAIKKISEFGSLQSLADGDVILAEDSQGNVKHIQYVKKQTQLPQMDNPSGDYYRFGSFSLDLDIGLISNLNLRIEVNLDFAQGSSILIAKSIIPLFVDQYSNVNNSEVLSVIYFNGLGASSGPVASSDVLIKDQISNSSGFSIYLNKSEFSLSEETLPYNSVKLVAEGFLLVSE